MITLKEKAINSQSKMPRLTAAIKKTREMVETCSESPLLRAIIIDKNGENTNKNAFTRKSACNARTVICVILLRIYISLQLMLDEYFEFEAESEEIELEATKQAFSEARKKINSAYIRSFADMTGEIAANEGDFYTYLGMRVFVIDGSTAALENTAALKKAFGCSGSAKNAATASISICFDPIGGYIIDSQIGRYGFSERSFAMAHIYRLVELGLKGSLILFDRGYPSKEFMAFLIDLGFHFVMRVRDKYDVRFDSVKNDQWIAFAFEGKNYYVRVMKIRLESGEIETLATTLSAKALPISKAAETYFIRWKVEVAYDMLKSKLQLENFSGKVKASVVQDFYATVYIANIVAFTAEEADKLVAENDLGKKLKYPRKANRNRVIRKVRNVFLDLINEKKDAKREKMLNKLIVKSAKHPVSITPQRASSKREKPRNKRYHIGKKAVV